MQVDESAPPKADAPKADKSKPQDVVAKTEAAPANESLATQPLAIVAEAVAEPIAAIDPVAKGQSEPKAKSAKTSIKKDKKQDKKAEEPIAVSKATSSEPVAPAFTNFATDYLVTPAIAGNRRRPGANMKSFMSMARDVKDMKKGSQGNQQKAKAAKKTEA